MRFFPSLVKFAMVLALAFGAWRLWVHWFPPVPKVSHDPLGIGYPDDPSKPESLKFVEALVLVNWDMAVSMKRGSLDNEKNFNQYKASMDRNESIYYRSEAELNEAARINILMNVYYGLLRAYDSDHSTNKLDTDFVEIEGYLTDYMENVRGIREYNINIPEDRAMLEAAGTKIPKKMRPFTRPGDSSARYIQ